MKSSPEYYKREREQKEKQEAEENETKRAVEGVWCGICKEKWEDCKGHIKQK